MKHRDFFIIVILIYIFVTISMTWPIILHLEGILLPENYIDISHSDFISHDEYIERSKTLYLDKQDFILIPISEHPDYELGQIYILSSILFSVYLNIDNIIFFNLYLLVSIFLSGLFMYLLMFVLSKDRYCSLFAGLLYMSSYYILHQYIWGHPALIAIQWIPLIFFFLELLIRTKKLLYSLLLGLSFAIQVLSSTQYTVYLSIVLPIYLLLRLFFLDKKYLFRLDFLFHISLSVFFAFILSSFYILRRLAVPTYERTLAQNMDPSLRLNSLADFLSFDSNLSFSILLLMLIPLGIIFLSSKKSDAKNKIFLPFCILFFIMILFMFGPVSWFTPYYFLYRLWPFVKYFRVPLRFFPFLLMCASILSSLTYLYISKHKFLKKYKYYIFSGFIFIFILLHIVFFHIYHKFHIFYLL